ncbi:MAG TPA: hypothetical protein VJP07_05440 [Dehalococcoidia bacterium]|nr:hypothetical protein [Dehalococcoidia bacterium]
MKTAKQEVLEAVAALPEGLSEVEIVEELQLRVLVRRRLDQVERGEFISHEDVEQRMSRWLDDSSGQ